MKWIEKIRCLSNGRYCCFYIKNSKEPCCRKKPLYGEKCNICGKYHCSVHLPQCNE